MKRSFYILCVVISACAVSKKNDTASYRTVSLDFKECLPESDYTSIDLSIKGKFDLKKVDGLHGFCEYRFTYSNGTIFYLSSDIYQGSQLNYKNRLSVGLDSYSVNRSENIEIKNGGMQKGGVYWMEWIRGDYVVGYVNAPDSLLINDLIKDIEINQGD